MPAKLSDKQARSVMLKANEQNLRARKVILDNPKCFLPEEVTKAEEILEKNNEVCARAKDESIHYLDRAMAELNCVKF